jgi:hypothetical protein
VSGVPAAAESRGPGATASTAPFFTVVVTAYRRRTYLREAVQSVVDQSISPEKVEIVVVKDFADPALDGWLESFSGRVRVVTEDLPLIGAMLVRGAELAHGEVVCFLEDDDRFLPGKLDGLAALFRSSSDLVFVRNAYQGIDASGAPLPSWERFRPQPPHSVDWSGRGDRPDLPWLYRYGGYINLSTMSIRADLLRRSAAWIRDLPASSDVVLFLWALGSAGTVRIERERWNDYRVHASTSHPVLQAGNEELDVRDVKRTLAAAEIAGRALSATPGTERARPMAEAFRLESVTVEFLVDRSARLAIGDWLRFAPWFARRRQKYLAGLWLYCVYRWLLPDRAVRSYRARRHGDLRGAASVPAPQG